MIIDSDIVVQHTGFAAIPILGDEHGRIFVVRFDETQNLAYTLRNYLKRNASKPSPE